MSNGLQGSRAMWGSALGLVLCLSCARQRAISTAVTASCPIEWTAPQQLEHDGGKPVAIDGGFAEIVDGHRSTFSHLALYWLERDQILDTTRAKDSTFMMSFVSNFTSVGGVIDDLQAVTKIDPPDPFFPSRTAIPRYSFQLAGWSQNKVRVAWLASDPQSQPSTSLEMTRLEVATYNGRTWTDRARVPISATSHEFVVPAHRAGRAWQTRAFAVPVSPRGGRTHVSVLVQKPSGWVVAKVDSTHLIFAPSIAELADGTLVLTDLATFRDVRGWYSRRGTVREDRITWDEPVLIDRVPGSVSPYTWAQLGGDSLLLVWHRDASDTSNAGARVAVSADGGTTWSAQSVDVLSSSSGGYVSLAVDVTGTPRLMFLTGGDDAVLGSRGRMVMSSWVNGRWTAPQPISPESTDGSQRLWALSDGSLLASWLKIRSYSTRGIAPSTIVAVGQPRCLTAPASETTPD